MVEKEEIEEELDIELSALVRNLPGIVYRCKNDEDWTMKFMSEACLELTGYEPWELIDNNKISWAELIEPKDRERVWEEIQEALEKDESFKITYTLITKDNEERVVWEQGRAIKNQEGEIEALEGFITDITERVKAKEMAEEREEKVKELCRAITRLQRCKTKEGVYKLALGAAREILDFYTSGILEEEEGELVLKARTKKSAFKVGARFPIGDSLLGRTFKEGGAALVKDVSKRDDAEPSMSTLKSGIDVAIGDIGMLLTASDQKGYYDEFDLETAKLLASSIYETVKRIESEKEKSLILDTTEELIIYQDTESDVIWANRAAAESVDSDVEELIGRKCYEIWHGKEGPCKGCPVRKAIKTGEREEGEISSDDGRHWLIRASPLKDENGEVKRIVEVALDITERKKASDELKENKNRIEELLKATSQMEKRQDMESIYEIAVDAAENIIDIDVGSIFVLENDKLALKAETSGVPQHDVKYRDIDDGVAGKVLKTKESQITNDLHSSEEAEPHLQGFKSGITIPIGDFGVFQAMSREKAHFDENDRNMLELLVAHVEEARERVELRKELEESEKRYRTIFEHTGTAMMIIEEDMTISLVNEELEKVSGYSRDRIEGKKKWTEFVYEEDLEKMKRFHQQRRESGTKAPNRYTFRGITRFGDVRYFLIEISMIPNTKKSVASLIDVTDYRKTFGALRESQEAFRVLFESNNEPIVLIETDNTIRDANDRFLEFFGKSAKEVDGKNWDEILPYETSQETREQMDQLLAGEKENIVIEYDGGKKIEMEVFLTRDNDDDPLFAIGILSGK